MNYKWEKFLNKDKNLILIINVFIVNYYIIQKLIILKNKLLIFILTVIIIKINFLIYIVNVKEINFLWKMNLKTKFKKLI